MHYTTLKFSCWINCTNCFFLILLIHLRIVLVYPLPLYSLVQFNILVQYFALSGISHVKILVFLFFTCHCYSQCYIYCLFTTIPSCFTLKYVASTNTIAYCSSNCLFCHSLISGMIFICYCRYHIWTYLLLHRVLAFLHIYFDLKILLRTF